MAISRIVFSGARVFSQTVEYALRAVVHLADHSPSPRTTDQIAAATLVPKPYLSKVIQGLCGAGILQSKRGVGGGVALVKLQENTVDGEIDVFYMRQKPDRVIPVAVLEQKQTIVYGTLCAGVVLTILGILIGV